MPKKPNKRKAGYRGPTRPKLIPSFLHNPGTIPYHPWLRIESHELGLPAPAIMCDTAELEFNGTSPQALGMLRIAEMVGMTNLPEIPLYVDLSSRYDVDLYDVNSDPTNPRHVLGGAFTDPHPDPWWDRIHGNRERLVLMAGPTPTIAAQAQDPRTDPHELLRFMYSTSWIGITQGLMVKAWPTGVGTHPQP